jgi:hypothetical protein
MIATDAALLEQALTGAEDAFTALYRRRQGGVYRFALQMTGSSAIAEDVTQEAFLALILHGTRYDEARGTVASFLYGIARNLVLRRIDPASLGGDGNYRGMRGAGRPAGGPDAERIDRTGAAGSAQPTSCVS